MLDTRIRTDSATPYLAWVLACAAAEAVGMTAAAGAATIAAGAGAAAGLAVIVGGGLVEGSALGWAQGRVLGRILPSLRPIPYLVATVLVAGLGWAAASAPSALSGDSDDAGPPLGLVVLGAAALGAVMGSVLGAAQAWALRGSAAHPWRWVGASAAAWPPAMVIVFVGATIPTGDWSTSSVLVDGAVTGAAAGAGLGLVSAAFLPSLDGIAVSDRIVLRLLAGSDDRWLPRGLIGLEIPGRVSGRRYRLPTQYAVAPGGLAILPGSPDGKTWWRNVRTTPTPIRVLREGVWAPASARLLTSSDPAHAATLAAYLERWPAVAPAADQPLVLVRLGVGDDSGR